MSEIVREGDALAQRFPCGCRIVMGLMTPRPIRIVPEWSEFIPCDEHAKREATR